MVGQPPDKSAAASALTCSQSGAEVVEIAQLLHAVSQARIEHEQLPDGLRLRLRASHDTEAVLREYVTREKACCPFLDLSVERHGGELQLEVHGPAQARPILALLSQLAGQAR